MSSMAFAECVTGGYAPPYHYCLNWNVIFLTMLYFCKADIYLLRRGFVVSFFANLAGQSTRWQHVRGILLALAQSCPLITAFISIYALTPAIPNISKSWIILVQRAWYALFNDIFKPLQEFSAILLLSEFDNAPFLMYWRDLRAIPLCLL